MEVVRCDWCRINFTWAHHWHYLYCTITTVYQLNSCEKKNVSLSFRLKRCYRVSRTGTNSLIKGSTVVTGVAASIFLLHSLTFSSLSEFVYVNKTKDWYKPSSITVDCVATTISDRISFWAIHDKYEQGQNQ